MEILIKRLSNNAILPAYSREAGPGIDLYALDTVTIDPGARMAVSTGIALAMPVGYELDLFGVSVVLATDESVQVTKSLVDSGYREEVVVELVNTSNEPQTITAGQSIAQLLVQKVEHARLIEAEDLGGA